MNTARVYECSKCHKIEGNMWKMRRLWQKRFSPELTCFSCLPEYIRTRCDGDYPVLSLCKLEYWVPINPTYLGVVEGKVYLHSAE